MVLGTIDAAIGEKTGIDLATGKNLVGAFYKPRIVIYDLDLLRELPGTEVTSGLAEVAKCGFISDAGILQLVDSDPGNALDAISDTFVEFAGRVVAVRAEAIMEDLTERISSNGNTGKEALNYGHMMEHTIKAHEGFRLRHG